jgi:hypothetical protein
MEDWRDLVPRAVNFFWLARAFADEPVSELEEVEASGGSWAWF